MACRNLTPAERPCRVENAGVAGSDTCQRRGLVGADACDQLSDVGVNFLLIFLPSGITNGRPSGCMDVCVLVVCLHPSLVQPPRNFFCVYLFKVKQASDFLRQMTRSIA